MKFKLIEKPTTEIEAERNSRHFYAHAVKGRPEPVCPIAVEVEGVLHDVYGTQGLDEDGIVKIMEASAVNFNDTKMLQDGFKIVSEWTRHNHSFSRSMIIKIIELRAKFTGPQREVIRDMAGPLMNNIESEAKRMIEYIKGMRGDFSPATDKEVITVLKNQDMLDQKRKEALDSKSI